MNGDAKVPQVLDAEHGRDDIAAQIVKDQHLPYGLAVLAEERLRGGDDGAI